MYLTFSPLTDASISVAILVMVTMIGSCTCRAYLISRFYFYEGTSVGTNERMKFRNVMYEATRGIAPKVAP